LAIGHCLLRVGTLQIGDEWKGFVLFTLYCRTQRLARLARKMRLKVIRPYAVSLWQLTGIEEHMAVTVRPLREDDYSQWRPLWDGYTHFMSAI
jgi:hypothetical protein